MEWKPLRQKNDLCRNKGSSVPGNLSKQCERNTCKYITVCRTAVSQNSIPCPHHMFGIDIVTHQFQCIVGLDRTTQVKATIVIKGPAIMLVLLFAQINGNLLFQFVVNLADEMIHQDIFSSNSAISFQFINPVTIRLLMFEQTLTGSFNGILKTERQQSADDTVLGGTAFRFC